jgi:hypothetical protein
MSEDSRVWPVIFIEGHFDDSHAGSCVYNDMTVEEAEKQLEAAMAESWEEEMLEPVEDWRMFNIDNMVTSEGPIQVMDSYGFRRTCHPAEQVRE